MSCREIGVFACVTLKHKRYQQLTRTESDAVNTALHSFESAVWFHFHDNSGGVGVNTMLEISRLAL